MVGYKMDIKIIAMDLDGTLLTDEKTVTPLTKEVLHKCRELGYKVVAVTARILTSLENACETELFDDIILNNGGCIYHCENSSIQIKGEISSSLVQKVKKEVEPFCEKIEFCTNKAYYVYKQKSNANKPFIIDIDSLDEVTETIMRMNVYFQEDSNLEAYRDRIKEKYPDLNCFLMQGSEDKSGWLVINPKGISKFTTLLDYATEKGIKETQILYFGDGLNDLEVMNSNVYSVAMGNALPEVKKVSKEITLTNNEDGIGKFLSKRLIRKED